MPIVERTPQACFDIFVDHIRALLAATVSNRYVLMPVRTENRASVSFREGNSAVAIPIDTDYGRLYFYFGQALEAISRDEQYQLKTRQYWYRIQHDSAFNAKAAIRWEYDSATARDKHARHHVQKAAELELGEGVLDLDKAHVPTGWVTIEEVIRFLIVDLGLEPPCGPAWTEQIIESERRFYQDFTGKFEDFGLGD